jgi:hypothetical protein
MGVRGPVPGDVSELSRPPNRTNVTVLSTDGTIYGPELPEKFVHKEWHPQSGSSTVEYEWPEQTRVWWDVWRMSAQASLMGEVDWCFMLDTAVLHALFWLGDHSSQLAAELRSRVAKFGATPDDRQRLRVAVSAPQSRAVVVRDGGRDSQRARLLQSAGGC